MQRAVSPHNAILIQSHCIKHLNYLIWTHEQVLGREGIQLHSPEADFITFQDLEGFVKLVQHSHSFMGLDVYLSESRKFLFSFKNFEGWKCSFAE